MYCLVIEKNNLQIPKTFTTLCKYISGFCIVKSLQQQERKKINKNKLSKASAYKGAYSLQRKPKKSEDVVLRNDNNNKSNKKRDLKILEWEKNSHKNNNSKTFQLVFNNFK